MNAVVNTVINIPMRFSTTSGVGKTGLAVVASARKAGTTTTQAGVVTERTGGDYDAAITFPSVGTWFYTGTTTIDGSPALWTETVQVATAIDTALVASITAAVVAALGSAAITVVSPVAANGDVTIVQGDDYLDVDARALAWSTTSAGQWPDLTSASIAFSATHPTDKSRTFTTDGTVTTPTGATKAVRVELTKTQTAAFLTPSEGYPFQVIATLAGSGDVVTLVDATMTVLPRRG